jgi:glycine/D-amino acid oxidase-like deaminating enzyme
LNDNSFQIGPPAAVRAPATEELSQNGSTVSLWSTKAQAFSAATVARGDLTTDVAVIGAGVAGLSTALHLAELGIETLVLEAEYPASAATGASGGILAPDFARDGIAKAGKLYGAERGERLARMVGKSATYTCDLIARLSIDCQVQQRGFVSPGQTPREVEAMRADARDWRSLGFSVEFLDARHTADAIGTDVYRGALLFESGGALNPAAYAHGLADTAHRAGVPIFTDSPVRTLEKTNGKWRLEMPHGRVHANRVVLAANGGNADLHPSLSSVALPLLVYEYATPPISEVERKRRFGAGLPYTDRRAYVFTARFDDDGRLISAIPEVFPGWSWPKFIREASRRMSDIYSMPLQSIEFAWSGTAYLNPTLLPAVYLPEGDLTLVAIQACNGRGLGVNTILGSEIAGLMASGNRESVSVPLLRPKPIPMHRLARHAPRMIMSVAQVKDRLRHS